MKRSMSGVSRLPHEKPGPFRRFYPGFLKPRSRASNFKRTIPEGNRHSLIVARRHIGNGVGWGGISFMPLSAIWALRNRKPVPLVPR